jgi:uncharacterized protein YggE
MRRIVTSALALAGTLALMGSLAACSAAEDSAAAQENEPSRDVATITVDGRGEIQQTPDLMTLTLGVESKAPSAQAALQQNKERSATLIATLKSKGVADRDLQTSNLSLSPTWDDKQNITGYAASNMVTVRLRDLDAAGGVVDAASSAVGDDIRMHGVAFSIDDTSSALEQARTKAVKQALAQAKQLAGAADVKLGAIKSIDDTNTDVPAPEYYARNYAFDGAASAQMAIEPGEQELSVDVRIVFEIDQG